MSLIPSQSFRLRQVVVVVLSVTSCCSISICSRAHPSHALFIFDVLLYDLLLSWPLVICDLLASPALFERDSIVHVGRELRLCRGEVGKTPVAVAEYRPSLCMRVPSERELSSICVVVPVEATATCDPTAATKCEGLRRFC